MREKTVLQLEREIAIIDKQILAINAQIKKLDAEILKLSPKTKSSPKTKPVQTGEDKVNS